MAILAYATKDGTIRWYATRLHINHAKKHMAKELRHTIALTPTLFNFALNNVREAIYLVDAQARYCYANAGASKMLGYSVEEILQLAVDDIAIAPDPAWWGRYWQQLKSTGTQTLQIEQRAKDGRVIPVEVFSNYVQYEGEGYSLAIVRDISERYQADAALRASEQKFRSLVENLPDSVVRYDTNYRRILTNPAYDHFNRIKPGQAQDTTPDELWRPANLSPDEYKSRLRRVLETGRPDHMLLEWRDEDDHLHAHTIHVVAEHDADGKITSLLALGVNISEQRQAEIDLAQRMLYLQTLLDNFPFMVWLKDTGSRLLTANSAYAKVVGAQTTKELEGKTDFDFFPPEQAEEYVAGDREAMQHDAPIGKVTSIKDANGDYYWIESYKSALRIDGKVVGSVGYARDITAAVKIEHELRSLVENSPNLVVRYDKDCRRIFINQRALEHYETAAENLLGKKPSEFPGGDSGVDYEKQIMSVLSSGKNHTFNMYWQNINGHARVSNIRLVPEFDASEQVVSVLGVGQDVTDAVENEARIHHLAYFDHLTDLPNRTLLTDRVNQVLAGANRHEHPFALMLLDLDRFKAVNDALGHAVGDYLLCEVASRLQACVRAYDTVSRLGGDEFAILLPEIRNETDLTTVACKVLGVFSLPFLFDGKELFVSTSIGIATYPNDSTELEGLLKFADSAMYHAKQQGRNNFQFYSSAMSTRASERIGLEAALHKALQNAELELYYQPQVDLRTGRVVGAEALLRWNHNGKLITPDRFIPVAEDTGIIVGIGEWVIATACQAAVQWNKIRHQPFVVAVNLSTRQFILNDLVGSIRAILRETGCQPTWIKLEITESLLLEDSTNIQAMLQQLCDLGLSISIDDFGTGYSSLAYLNRFPVSQIKIDRSFVQDFTIDDDKAALIEAIVSMARSLRKELVAEGVETKEQAEHLARIGCCFAQGYLFGRPSPHSVMHALIAGQPEISPENFEIRGQHGLFS